MTDYKALCAELADSVEILLDMRPTTARPLQITEERLSRARAALAEPEPEGPTDDELWQLGNDDFRTSCWPSDAIVFARAVLARWGRPTLQPVPVSERLPGDALCWWFTPESGKEYGWWVLETDGMEREPQPTHWLPAHALPVPTND